MPSGLKTEVLALCCHLPPTTLACPLLPSSGYCAEESWVQPWCQASTLGTPEPLSIAGYVPGGPSIGASCSCKMVEGVFAKLRLGTCDEGRHIRGQWQRMAAGCVQPVPVWKWGDAGLLLLLLTLFSSGISFFLEITVWSP